MSKIANIVTSFFSIIFTLIISFASLCGYGIIFSLLMHIPIISKDKTFHISRTALLGLPFYVFLGMILHFFLPLNSLLAVFLQSIGLLVCVIFILLNSKNFSKTQNILLIFIPLVFVVSERIFNSSVVYDTGLYHLQTILWNRAEPIVLGLVNLQNRFGFNSTLFVFAAEIGLPKIWLPGIFSVNGLILLLTIAYFLEDSIFCKNKQFEKLFSSITVSLLLLGKIYFLGELGSPGTDLPAMLFCILICYEYVKSVHTNTSHLLIPFLFLLPTIKLSYAAFSIFLLIFLYIQKKLSGKNRVLYFFLTCVFFWMLRGVFLSGCVIYPQEKTCLNLPWSAAASSAINAKEWVYSWARNSEISKEIVLSDMTWIFSWFPRFLTSFEFGYFSWSIVALVVMYQKFKQELKNLRKYFLLFWAMAINSIYWFFTAPDPRFNSGIFLSFSLLLTTQLVYFYVKKKYKKSSIDHITHSVYLTICFVIVVQSIILCTSLLFKADKYYKQSWPSVPVQSVSIKNTVHGDTIYVPINSEQCWASQLPCTPYFNARLHFSKKYYWHIFSKRDVLK